jgi:hypothetical protein
VTICSSLGSARAFTFVCATWACSRVRAFVHRFESTAPCALSLSCQPRGNPQINLPPGFATDTLQRIDFISFGEASNGSPFVAAVTALAAAPLQSIPVLSPWMLILLCVALGSVGIALSRQPAGRDADD